MQALIPSLITGTVLALGIAGTTPRQPTETTPPSRAAAPVAKQSPGLEVQPKLQCTRGDVAIAVCGAANSLFPTCTDTFKKSCEVEGGTTSSCGPDGSECKGNYHCSSLGGLFAECDKDFKTACEDASGTFECQSKCGEGEGGGLLRGQLLDTRQQMIELAGGPSTPT